MTGHHGSVSGSLSEGYVVSVWNEFVYDLPSSGSSAVYIIYIIGSLMVGLGVVLLARLRRDGREAD